LKKQVTRETRLKLATDILDNSGDLQTLNKQVKKLHKKFIAL